MRREMPIPSESLRTLHAGVSGRRATNRRTRRRFWENQAVALSVLTFLHFDFVSLFSLFGSQILFFYFRDFQAASSELVAKYFQNISRMDFQFISIKVLVYDVFLIWSIFSENIIFW